MAATIEMTILPSHGKRFQNPGVSANVDKNGISPARAKMMAPQWQLHVYLICCHRDILLGGFS